jgi:glycosyltransferase involved in cell wall biosynthesis
MAKSMRACGGNVCIVSWGRGRQDGSGAYFQGVVKRVQGVPVVYLDFLNLPVLSEVISLLAPAIFFWRKRYKSKSATILFYNRLAAYLPTVLLARVLRCQTFLDLEDGDPRGLRGTMRRRSTRTVNWLFDHLCKEGVLLACEALLAQTRIRPAICYYGSVECQPRTVDWHSAKLSVLMGGTLSQETGAQQLIDAITILRDQQNDWATELEIQVTGRGDCLASFENLGSKQVNPLVIVHGRTTDAEYARIVARSHVGLALKPRAGNLAYTTFPSKVTEMAGAGLIVVTTDISDVRKVLDGHALYVGTNSAQELIENLKWIALNRTAAKALAEAGANAIYELFNPKSAGKRLLDFLISS